MFNRTKLELVNKLLAVSIAFFLPLSTFATNVLFILTALFSLIAIDWREKYKLIIYNPIALLFLMFFALFIIGISYTSASVNEVGLIVGKYSKFLLAIFFLPLFTEEAWRRYAINAFLSAIGIMLFFSYFKAFGFIGYEIANGGPVEVFKGHIDFSFLMAFGAYLVILKSIQCSRCKWLWLIFLGLILYNLFFMGIGRSGYFIFIVLLFLVFLQKMRLKGLFIAAVSISMLISGVYNLSTTFHSRIHDIANDFHVHYQKPNSETSIGLRLSFIKNSLSLIKKHPIIGTGTGSFKCEYSNIKPKPYKLINNPHNEYLNIGVQFGILGIMFLIFMFGKQLIESFKLPDDVRFISQAVVLSIMVGCLANSWLLDTTEGHFYAYFIVVTFAGNLNFKKEIGIIMLPKI